MAKHRPNSSQRPTWGYLKSSGDLSERHVLMAISLGMGAATIQQQHRSAPEADGLLLLEWIEDLYFAKFGTYSPVDENATPDAQGEHPAENSLLPDPDEVIDAHIQKRRRQLELEGRDEEETDDEDWYFEAQQEIEKLEKETPVSYGEIHEEDCAMLERQENFRKSARLLTKHLAKITEVRKVVLFGSTALPLWKEVPRFSRLRNKGVKIYHEVRNIDVAVWVTDNVNANQLRKAASTTVSELLQNEVHLSVAPHHYSLHLVEQLSGRYLGMVCHFKKCPNHKPECAVAGCGATQHVRILPWFHFKPHRLNNHNSQVLYSGRRAE